MDILIQIISDAFLVCILGLFCFLLWWLFLGRS